jgi:hypothetical protein
MPWGCYPVTPRGAAIIPFLFAGNKNAALMGDLFTPYLILNDAKIRKIFVMLY